MVSGKGAEITDADGNDLRRPGRLLGSDDPRPRPSRRAGRGCRRRRPRPVLRHPGRGRGAAGRGDRGQSPCGGAGPAGLLRHRGHHVGDPAGPRLHRPVQDRQVRRLLPRSCRRAAGLRRIRGRHLRPARLRRRHRCHHRRGDRRALQRHRRGASGFRRASRRDRRGDHRGRRGQHGRRPAASRGSTPGSPQIAPRRRRAADHRRGDDRASG